MVRFIINIFFIESKYNEEFTFQYGQIYYYRDELYNKYKDKIYIPIWLDLLSLNEILFLYRLIYLHSNMVRFIISLLAHNNSLHSTFTFQYGQIYYRPSAYCCEIFIAIYIPIWLDLLWLLSVFYFVHYCHLHSNMVRFIIKKRLPTMLGVTDLHSNMVRFIIRLIPAVQLLFDNLHSNMVRFIIMQLLIVRSIKHCNLHSNMVRFIIQSIFCVELIFL